MTDSNVFKANRSGQFDGCPHWFSSGWPADGVSWVVVIHLFVVTWSGFRDRNIWPSRLLFLGLEISARAFFPLFFFNARDQVTSLRLGHVGATSSIYITSTNKVPMEHCLIPTVGWGHHCTADSFKDTDSTGCSSFSCAPITCCIWLKIGWNAELTHNTMQVSCKLGISSLFGVILVNRHLIITW